VNNKHCYGVAVSCAPFFRLFAECIRRNATDFCVETYICTLPVWTDLMDNSIGSEKQSPKLSASSTDIVASASTFSVAQFLLLKACFNVL
jgi:hypothetical protein